MAEGKIEGIMREAIEVFNKKEVEKVLSFFAEDAAWVAPEGTFKGKEELKRYLTWLFECNPDLTAIDAGIGIMVQENKAVHEHIFRGTFRGRKWKTPVICVYEFSNEKIKEVRSVYDRLSMARQAAKGCGKRLVPYLIMRAERGLR